MGCHLALEPWSRIMGQATMWQWRHQTNTSPRPGKLPRGVGGTRGQKIMCGIAGKLVFDPAAPVSEAEMLRMIAPLAHRGPDGRGVHLDGNVGLGHCRLSIIDLNTGAQPMTNEDET